MSTTTPQKYRKVNYSNNNYNIDVYSYNPFTDKLPSTTEHWKYIKYKPKNDGIQTTFDFVKPTDAVDDNIWVLYGGSGGYGGSSKSGAGGGGGGGSGELKLSLLNKTTFTNINCTIGILNNQYSIDYGGSRNYNYNTTSATTLAIKNKTTTTDTLIDTLKATGGFNGDYMNKGKTGGVGGHGAKVVIFNGSNLVLNTTTETYDTATITTIPFGSMGGGGGYGNGDKNSEMGDRYELIPQTNSTTKFDYKYVADTTVRKYTDGDHSGVNTNFNISLSGVPCDGTGIVRILKPGDAGSAAAYGSPSAGGFIMFFYKTTPSSLQQYSQSFPPSMNIYNYNPFTNLAPYPDNWVYYKYNYDDIETQFNFKHTIQNIPVGEPVWILYAGCGGNNGGYNAGCGGGGGPGETVLSVIPRTNTTTTTNPTTGYVTTTDFTYSNTTTGDVTTTTTTTTKTSAATTATVISTNTTTTTNLVLNCKIGSINYNSEASNANSKTTITYGPTTLTANEGFCGATTANDTGANGGTGGGLPRYGYITQNTSTDTTFRFGSGGGGGGGSIKGADNGEYGNRTVCSLQSGSTTTYDYKYVVNNGRGRGGYGCAVDFNKTLKGNYCDGTGYILDAAGNASFLIGGGGGKSPGNNQSVNGENGPAGFIMIFHKTTRPLTKNYYPPTGASFGRNPINGFMPSYTNFINEKAYFFVNSGNSASVSAADFNTMFKLTGTSDTNPTYLAVGGGGGGGSPWWDLYCSFGGGGGGGGQPKYGTIGRQTDGTLSFRVGGDGDTRGRRGDSVVGNSGGDGGETTLTFGTTSITAAGGGGGQNAGKKTSYRMALAGYGGGMGGRNNVTVQSSTTGPSGGFGSLPFENYAHDPTYYDAKASDDLADFDGGDALRLIRNFNDDWFTWYQETPSRSGFSYVAHTTYGPDPAPWWRNGYDLNLTVSTDYFSQGSFRVTYGGDAGNDGLSGIKTGQMDAERSAYSGNSGGSGYILLWGKGPSGQV